MRVRGVGSVNVWCSVCLGGALPFVGIVGEGDYRGALREYREGLASRAGEFLGLRFDPFDGEIGGSWEGWTRPCVAARIMGGMRWGLASGVWPRGVGAPFRFCATMSGVQGARGWRCWRES